MATPGKCLDAAAPGAALAKYRRKNNHRVNEIIAHQLINVQTDGLEHTSALIYVDLFL